jgi:hypothetical protein
MIDWKTINLAQSPTGVLIITFGREDLSIHAASAARNQSWVQWIQWQPKGMGTTRAAPQTFSVV